MSYKMLYRIFFLLIYIFFNACGDHSSHLHELYHIKANVPFDQVMPTIKNKNTWQKNWVKNSWILSLDNQNGQIPTKNVLLIR